jgi:signal transduction histidine kinase/CheY-like chemotaxis protein/ligand-binding sensor domain-containing protein
MPPRPNDPFDLDLIGRIPVKAYTELDGLPGRSVFALTFDRDGRLWAGTDLGLAHYNGRVWTEVPIPENAPSKYVRALCVGRDGCLWVGTQGGLLRYADAEWRLVEALPTEAASGPAPARMDVRAVLETDEGDGTAVWVATDRGVGRLSGGRWRLFETSSGLPSEDAWVLLSTTDERGKPSLLVGTNAGIARHTIGDDRWSVVASAAPDGLPDPMVRSLLETSSGLWAGTRGGLARYDGGRWSVFDTSSGLPHDSVWSLAETVEADGSTVLWAGTRGGGLARYDGRRWRVLGGDSTTPIDLQVWRLLGPSAANDSPGLWAGTGGGVARIGGGAWRSIELSTILTDSCSVAFVETAGEAGASALWVGTNAGGLARLEGGRWTAFDTASGLPANAVTQIAETGGRAVPRTLWVGTFGGLVRYVDGRFIAVEGTEEASTLSVSAIREPIGDEGNGRAWVTTDRGLATLEGHRLTRCDLPPDVPRLFMDTVEVVDARGARALWFAAWRGGLVRWSDPPHGRVDVFRAADSGIPSDEVAWVRQFDEDDGRRYLWVGTASGLAWRDLDDDSAPWATLTPTTTPPLPGGAAYRMERDARGRFYVMTNKGVVRLERRGPMSAGASAFSTHTFTTEDGLPSLEGTQASLVDSLGRIWLSTVAGPVVFDPALEVEDRTPKPLVFERVTVNGEPRDLGAHRRLSWRESNVELEFALLSYFREADTRYRSQLVGFDREPTAWTSDHRRIYTNLPAGKYVFRVWGRDYAGNVAGPAEVPFEIRTAPWKSWWAYAAYAGAAVGAAYAGVRYRVDSLERRGRELEALVAQRTAELIESEQRAQEANESKSTFLANMSHELRTPLNAVLGFANLMGREDGRTDADREHLDIIQRSGEHLLGLIDDVLSIAKIEAGRLTLVEQPFDLGVLLSAVHAIVSVRAEAKGLELVFAVESDLPPAVVADEGKLRQVLINLLGNAVKFTERGSIALRARWSDGRAHFEVADTGQGIAEDELETLFEPFVQTESGRRATEGTGLGLAISRRIVGLMGGDITVESRLGRGTTFRFEIDLPSAGATLDAGQASRVSRLADGQAPTRILVADDTPENRLLLVRLLSTVGFEVREAANGLEAIAAWRAWRPQAILMDMRMPVMDGREALRRIRSEEEPTERCVVIALTASAFEHERAELLAGGADDFVAKPFREQTIFDTLAEHLGVRYVSEHLAEPEPHAAGADDAPLTTERFSALPAERVRELRDAIRVGDLEEARRVAEALASIDEPLSIALLSLIRQFRVDELFALLERMDPPA